MNPGVGFRVAIFDDYRGLQRKPPFRAQGVSDRPGAGNHYGFFGNNKRLGVHGGMNNAADQIVLNRFETWMT